MPHARSQALWEEFRASCNAVFERRQQAFAAQSVAVARELHLASIAIY